MKNIALLGLGGTIQHGMINGSLSPKYNLDDIVKTVQKDHQVNTRQLVKKDSNNITRADVSELLACIHNLQLDKETDGIIVTIGTDRMVDVASLVEYSLRPANKPIIFTGSMYSCEHERSDGRINLENSLKLIERINTDELITKGELYGGVFIVIGKNVVYPHSAVKINIESTDGFLCAWGREVCIFSNGIPIIKKRRVNRARDEVPQFYKPKFGRISVENINFDYEPNIEKLSDLEAIIYVGTGDGNFPGTLRDTMRFLSETMLVPQIVCSGVPIRSNGSLYEAGNVEYGIVQSVLPVQSATSKLFTSLGSTGYLTGENKKRFVLEYMKRDIAGEFEHLRDW